MIILPWSDDFETGIEILDNEHRRLFEMINVFAVISKIHVNTMDIVEFIDELKGYALGHFENEERYMKEKGYPLLDYHKKFHETLEIQLEEAKELLKKKELENPLETMITFARDWLITHVGKEDLSFAYFCKNEGNIDSKEFKGCSCEILGMREELLGQGIMSVINEHEITIKTENDQIISLKPNDLIKIKLLDSKLSGQFLSARVTVSKKGFVRVFHAKHIKENNSREVVNVATQIGATMIYDNRSIAVEIINMSLEGLLIETKEVLQLQMDLIVVFIMLNKQIVLPCKIESKKDEQKYNCKFKELLDWQEDLIFSYVLDRQRINTTLSKTAL